MAAAAAAFSSPLAAFNSPFCTSTSPCALQRGPLLRLPEDSAHGDPFSGARALNQHHLQQQGEKTVTVGERKLRCLISLATAKGLSFTWRMQVFLNTNPTFHGWMFGFFSTGLTQQISDMTNVSLRLDLSWQYLLHTGSDGSSGEVNCLKTTQNNGEKQKKSDVMLNNSIWLVITIVSKAPTGTYTCRMENTTNMCENGHCKQNKDGKRHKPTNTHGSGEKGLRKGEEKAEREDPAEKV